MTKEATGHFGQWLRQWRKDNRWSMTAFANKIGMSKSCIWALEHGIGFNPTIETLLTISLETGAPVTRLAGLAAKQKLEEQPHDH